MCLVKVKQEEEVVVPYRVAQRSNHSRRASHASARRYSRTTEVVRESPRPSTSYISMPAPKPLQIPAPQPVPVFVEPPPRMPMPVPAAPPPPPSHHGGPHYVEVSPRSSVTSTSSSAGRSDYVYREREVRRERQYSPERAPRYEHFRYVEPATSESDHYQRRDRSRQRSRSRAGYEEARGSYRETNTRVTLVDEDSRRRREYTR